MGVKSFNLHVRQQNLDDVEALIERSEISAAYITSSGRGWSSIAVDIGDEEAVDELGKLCSRRPGGFAVSLLNFDEDVLMVDLYVDGEHVSRLGVHSEEYFPAEHEFGSVSPLLDRLAMPVPELDLRRLLEGARPSPETARLLAVATALEDEAASNGATDPDRIRAQVAMSTHDELLGEHMFPSQIASWLAVALGIRACAAYASYESIQQDLQFGEGEFPGLTWRHVGMG